MMRYNVSTSDGIILDDYLWFSNIQSNGLFRVNLKTGIIEFIDFFPDEKTLSKFLHKRCFAYEDKLIFLPALSRRIVIYDITCKRFSSIPYENELEGEAILCAERYGGKIFIFPRSKSCVPLSLDLNTFEVTKIEGFDKEIDKYVNHNNPEKFYRVCEWNGFLLFGLCETDIIALWNPEQSTFRIYHTGINKIINIIIKNNISYFTSREQYGLYRLDLESEEVSFLDCKRDNNFDGNLYGDLVEWNNKIVAIPAFGYYIHVFDENGLFFECKNEELINDKYKFFRCVHNNENFWFLPIGINDFYIMDKDYIIKKFAIKSEAEIEENAYYQQMKRLIKEENIIAENEDTSLHNFLNVISNFTVV